MTSSRYLAPLFAAAAVLIPLLSAASAALAQARRPNIVVIVADDLGWRGVGYHNGFAKTPNIDRIAKQGVELDRFYVSPMCSPTRAGLMTGRYPMRYGMARSVVRPWARFGLPPGERTLPEALAQAGYKHRGAFGKWHLGHLEPKWHPLAQGFTEYKGLYNGAGDYFTRVRDGETDWHENGEPVDEQGYTTNLIADAASDFITRHAKDGPFFCYVPFSAPHDPFQAQEEYVQRYAHLDDTPTDGKPSDKQIVAAMIAGMDDGVGRILAAVEKAGVAKDTLVLFSSDNGGVEKIPGNNVPLRAGKLTVYEGGVRVPACVWWPGVIEGGRKVDAPIVNVDLFPTLLALAGAKAQGDKPLDGVDVSGVLTGKQTKTLDRDLYFFNGQVGLEREQNAVTTPDGWKLIVQGPDVRRPGGYNSPAHKIELFNVIEDPSEKTDRAAEQPQLVEELAAKIVAFRKSEPAESLPPINRKPPDFVPPPKWRNAPAPAERAADPNRPKPNVLFVFIDDMGYRDLGCFGGTRVKTPAIDRLAAEGIAFDRFYVNSPICSPSRVAVMTGQYPNRWRITSFLNTREDDRKRGVADWLSPDAPFVARYFQNAGYHTAHVGKWHMGGQRDVADAPSITAYGFHASVTNFEGLGPRILPKFGLQKKHGPTDMSAEFGGPGVQWEARHKVTERFVDRAIEEIDAAREARKPFFINLWPDDVHGPCEPPPHLRGDGSKSALYLGVLNELDRQLGHVFDHVRSDPALRDNTVILLASDNGHEPGAGTAGDLRGNKATLYEGGIRSPLIVWAPGHMASSAKPGMRNDTTVLAGMDLPPSLLAIAGIDAPKDVTFDGLDMSAVLTGASKEPRKAPVMWVRPPDRPGPPKRPLPDLAVRDGDWKLLVGRDGSRAELFDVVKDPNEATDLAKKHPDVVKRLSDAVIAWDRSIDSAHRSSR